jgi:hypothetical protein
MKPLPTVELWPFAVRVHETAALRAECGMTGCPPTSETHIGADERALLGVQSEG